MHHSSYLFLADEPQNVNCNGDYSDSPFQNPDNFNYTYRVTNYTYRVTIAVSPVEHGDVQLFTEETPIPTSLRENPFAGVYKGVSIPEKLRDSLINNAAIYGQRINSQEGFEKVFVGKNIEKILSLE